MMELIKYKILPDEDIIITHMKGDIPAKDILQFMETVKNDPFFSSGSGVLIDARKGVATHNTDEIEREFITQIDDQTQDQIPLRIAVIVDTPAMVAEVILFNLKAEQNRVKLNISIFSTVEGSLAFLGLFPSDLDKIHRVLQELQ